MTTIPTITRLMIAAWILFSVEIAGGADAVDAPEQTIEAVPGGLHILPLRPGDETVVYQSRPVLILDGVAVVGIPLSADPGQHELRIRHRDGSEQIRHFQVHHKQYTEQRITIENPRMVNPDPQDLDRIRSESAKMGAQYLRYSTFDTIPSPFLQPVDGPLSSSFGRRRILNDQPRNPHSGLDIAAVTGTPIEAPAPGKVTLTGDFFFNGNTVFMDHGGGLVTMYCHLSEITAQEGQWLARGDTLGLVGSTGRVTGPHLHWSVSLNGNRVDPVQVMRLLTP